MHAYLCFWIPVTYFVALVPQWKLSGS